MATYQFTLEMLPADWVSRNKDALALLHDDLGFDTSIAWREKNLSLAELSLVSVLLPETKITYGYGSAWGKDDSDYIHLCNDELSNTESLAIRIDLRKDFRTFLSKIIKLANQLGCVFYLPILDVIVPCDEQKILKLILNSDSKKFVDDPWEFLRNLD